MTVSHSPRRSGAQPRPTALSPRRPSQPWSPGVALVQLPLDLSCYQCFLCFPELGNLWPSFTVPRSLSQHSSPASPPTNTGSVFCPCQDNTHTLAKGTSDNGCMANPQGYRWEGLRRDSGQERRQGSLLLAPQLRPLQGGSGHQKIHLSLLCVGHE